MRLVLASSSQRRRELMSMCGYDYEIVVSNADENIVEHDPQKLVSALAEKKAREVYDRLIAEGADPSELAVVGSDTVVAFNGEIIGKPRDEKDAAGILKKLTGNTHTVHTGIAVISRGSVQQDVSTTEVRFCTLADDEINAYVASGEPTDKAGAYGIQGPFGMFVESICGNYFTIIGLPLPILYRMLKNIGILPTLRRID